LNSNERGFTIHKEVAMAFGGHGNLYKGDKRKLKKTQLEKKAVKQMSSGMGWQLPQVEIIKKGKKDW